MNYVDLLLRGTPHLTGGQHLPSPLSLLWLVLLPLSGLEAGLSQPAGRLALGPCDQVLASGAAQLALLPLWGLEAGLYSQLAATAAMGSWQALASGAR